MPPQIETDGDHPEHEDEVKRHRHIHSCNREPAERGEEPSRNCADTAAYTQPTEPTSYVRKLVTELSGGVFGFLDSVLERHSFDEFGELI